MALAAVVALIAAVAVVSSNDPIVAYAEVPPAPHFSDAPPITAHVLAGAVEASVLPEIEQDLTEEAQARVTSTTTLPPPAEEVGVDDVETAPAPAETPGATTPASPSPTTTTTTVAATTTTTEPAEEPPPSGSFDPAAESQFAGLINSVRSSNGLGALSRDGSLDARARDWAKYMAESGSLSHSNLGSLMPPWTAVAENVGQGGSVSQIFDLLAGSSGHLANMLGPYTHFGIGVWRDADGVLWTTHVFAG